MSDRREHDNRPSIRHDRTTEDTFDAFIFVPGTYEVPGRPCRLRLMCGDKTLVAFDLIEERTTSESARAETLDDGVMNQISMTTEEAVWLHEILGRALAWEREYEARANSAAREPERKEGSGT